MLLEVSDELGLKLVPCQGILFDVAAMILS